MYAHRRMTKPDKIVERIVRYWDTAGLCSPESSTSHGDPDLAWLDNEWEARILMQALNDEDLPKRRLLDVGAGLGRFVPIFKQLAHESQLLEPAPSLYRALYQRCQGIPGIVCAQQRFEAFESQCLFDIIFTSGVLYLYNDQMVDRFVSRAAGLLSGRGLFIVRDFVVSPNAVVLPSRYVSDGYCYYRPEGFWKHVGEAHDLKLMACTRSKPDARFLRDRRVIGVLQRLKMKRWLRSRLVADLILRLSLRRQKPRAVQSVFILLRKGPQPV